MSAFETRLRRTGRRTWAELTHKEICQLCALWLAENQTCEFPEAVYREIETGTLTSHLIDVFNALGRAERDSVMLSRVAIAGLIQQSATTAVQQEAERLFVQWESTDLVFESRYATN